MIKSGIWLLDRVLQSYQTAMADKRERLNVQGPI
jgi:hypothetical protein